MDYIKSKFYYNTLEFWSSRQESENPYAAKFGKLTIIW